MSEKKTNIGLVAYCLNQLGKPYWWGTFGQIASESLYQQKKKQYPSYYTANDFSSQYGAMVHDCVGLIKGYRWRNDGKLGYKPNQDVDVSGMLKLCSKQGPISTMPDVIGALVFMNGHVGVYIGNGEVIEARGHAYGVAKTKLKERPWTKWGQPNWLEYEEVKMEEFKTYEEARNYLQEQNIIDSPDFWNKANDTTKNIDKLFIKFANAYKSK